MGTQLDSTETTWCHWLLGGEMDRFLGVAPTGLPHHGFVIVGLEYLPHYPGIVMRQGRSKYPSADHAREAVDRINVEAGNVCGGCEWWITDCAGHLGACSCPVVVHLHDYDQRVRLSVAPCLVPVGFKRKQS